MAEVLPRGLRRWRVTPSPTAPAVLQGREFSLVAASAEAAFRKFSMQRFGRLKPAPQDWCVTEDRQPR